MSRINEARVVLVCTDCDNTRILYHALKDEIPFSAIITEQPVSRKLMIKRRIKRLGLFKTASQLVFQAVVVPLVRKQSKARVKQVLDEYQLKNLPLPPDKVIKVETVNSELFISELNRLQPDLVLVNGTRIISGLTLDHVNCPIINVHVGITPLYRGVHGAYWAMANNDAQNCGVTIHAIDRGIDTGAIIAQGTIKPGRADNFITYPFLQFAKAIELLRKVIPGVLKGEISYLEPPTGKSRLWYHPTIWQYLSNRFKGIK